MSRGAVDRPRVAALLVAVERGLPSATALLAPGHERQGRPVAIRVRSVCCKLRLVLATLTTTAGMLAAASDDVGLPPRSSLTTLLTTESLIFAAFSISATLSLPTAGGRRPFYSQGTFAYCIVAVLFAIATSACFALYATLQPDSPHGVNEWIRAAGIGIGVVAQPFAALAIAMAMKKVGVVPEVE